MVINGYKMVRNGNRWLEMDTDGWKWIQMVRNEYRWLEMDIDGQKWISMV